MLLQCGDGGVLGQLLRFVQDEFRVKRGVLVDTSTWEQRQANLHYMLNTISVVFTAATPI